MALSNLKQIRAHQNPSRPPMDEASRLWQTLQARQKPGRVRTFVFRVAIAFLIVLGILVVGAGLWIVVVE